MILSSETISILKNYSTINQSFLFSPGSKIATISPLRTIFSSAFVKESFEKECGIYEMNKFLSVLSLFKEPELHFEDKWVNIVSGKQKVKYTYCDKDMMHCPPKNQKEFPAPTVSFHFTADSLSSLMKATSALQLPQIAIRGDGKTITIEGVGSKEGIGDTYQVAVSETDKHFTLFYKVENLKFMQQDYRIDISSMGNGGTITKFATAEDKMIYYIASEATSKFGE